MEKTNIYITQKPKSLNQEEYDLMEKIALCFEQYRINDLEDILLDDGEYTIPGKRHSIEVKKAQFLKYFKSELKIFKKIYKDEITHHYSVCDFCIFGHVVLKFSKSLSHEAFTNWGTAFRIGIKDGKVNLMEVCFNDIERSDASTARKSPPKDEKDFGPEIIEPFDDGETKLHIAFTLKDRLEYAKKYLDLELYEYCKKEMHAFNKLSSNMVIEGFFNDKAIKELFTNPELIETEKKEVYRDLDFWIKYYTDLWETERIKEFGELPSFGDDGFIDPF